MTIEQVLREALDLIQVSLKPALILAGQSDAPWLPYVQSGIVIANKAIELEGAIRDGSTKVVGMTPDEIRAYLKPASWDDLVKEAAGG